MWGEVGKDLTIESKKFDESFPLPKVKNPNLPISHEKFQFTKLMLSRAINWFNFNQLTFWRFHNMPHFHRINQMSFHIFHQLLSFYQSWIFIWRGKESSMHRWCVWISTNLQIHALIKTSLAGSLNYGTRELMKTGESVLNFRPTPKFSFHNSTNFFYSALSSWFQLLEHAGVILMTHSTS